MENNSDQHLVREGEVIAVLKGNFRVLLKDNNETSIVRVSGKMRQARIQVLLGDRVEVKFSVYDPQNNGIISRRL